MGLENLLPYIVNVTHNHEFVPQCQADASLKELLENTPWQEQAITLFGRSVIQHR